MQNENVKSSSHGRPALQTIFLSGSIAGTLDLLAAFLVYSGIMKVTTATKILQSISAE